jgi:hypothetical protein
MQPTRRKPRAADVWPCVPCMRSCAIAWGRLQQCTRPPATGCLAGVPCSGRRRKRRCCGRSAKSSDALSAPPARWVRRSSTSSPPARAGTVRCRRCSFGRSSWRGCAVLRSTSCAGSTSVTPGRGSSMRATTGPYGRAEAGGGRHAPPRHCPRKRASSCGSLCERLQATRRRNIIPGRTGVCRRPPIAYARASLRLSAAPGADRSPKPMRRGLSPRVPRRSALLDRHGS